MNARGSAIEVVLATLLPALLLTAVVLDLGALAVARGQLRHALDAAALAGVAHLDGTEAGAREAVTQAVAFASYNQVAGWPVTLDPSVVQLGEYDEVRGFVPTDNPAQADSISLDVVQPDFGIAIAAGWLGMKGLQLRALARARTGAVHAAGGCDCFLPIAVPQCVLEDSATYEGKELRIGIDTVGWATPGGPVSADEVVRQLYSPCMGPPVVVGSEAGLMAAPVAAAAHAVDQILAKGVLEGPVMLVSSPGADGCGDPTRFQKAEITGFAWGRIRRSGDALLLQLDLTSRHKVGNRPGGVPGSTITWQDRHELY